MWCFYRDSFLGIGYIYVIAQFLLCFTPPNVSVGTIVYIAVVAIAFKSTIKPFQYYTLVV